MSRAENEKPAAIPVRNSVGTGTAFLATKNGETALYTVAHNLGPYQQGDSGLIDISGWEWADAELRLLVTSSDGEPLNALRLFDSVLASTQRLDRLPRFSFLALPNPQRTKDLVRFDGPAVADVLAHLSTVFRVIDLDDASPSLSPGEPLVCSGFPTGDSSISERDSSECRGTYLGSGETYDWAAMSATFGYSGGPIFNSSGKFVGMVAGCRRKLEGGKLTILSWFVTSGDIVLL